MMKIGHKRQCCMMAGFYATMQYGKVSLAELPDGHKVRDEQGGFPEDGFGYKCCERHED